GSRAVTAGGLDTALTRDARVAVPLIGGAMFPCSNPELVAAVSEAGGIGIVQPLSMVYVHGHELREGLRLIRRLTPKPIGMNVLIEQSSRLYLERMQRWVDVAIEEGVRLFITSLGKPRWVVDRVAQAGGLVYHDVTERKWALKGLESGVRGLIAVNHRAGGHAGPKSAGQLMDELGDLGVPLVCAGGIGDAAGFVAALHLGYAGAQLGTRFIATVECTAHPEYKSAIVAADEDDIVLTERVTGVPLAVIRTPYVERVGTRAGPIARRAVEVARHGAKAERLSAHDHADAVGLGPAGVDGRRRRGIGREPQPRMPRRGHGSRVEHEDRLYRVCAAGHRIDGEYTVPDALHRGERDDETVRRVRWHEDQIVRARREEDCPAQVAEAERAPPHAIDKHREGRSTANRVQHADARSL